MSHISWSFLDKRRATVEAIKAFDSMKFIITNTAEEIQNVRSKMGSVVSPRLSGLPSVHNPHAREDRLLSGIDRIDVLRERYRHAVEYMEWFNPAWEQLSEDEKFVLKNTIELICTGLKIEKTSAYRKKERALKKLSNLLYG